MIEEFGPRVRDFHRVPYRIYGLGLGHKHVDEMKTHGGLDHPPISSRRSAVTRRA